MRTKPIIAAVGVAIIAITLTACHSNPEQPASRPPAAARTSAPPVTASGFDEPPAVGSTATAAPSPSCSTAVADWTAATTGRPWVTVNAAGVDTVTTTVTLAAGATVHQSFTIPEGEDTHVFEFNDVAPTAVKSVLVTASGDARSEGGSCQATGSPTG